MTGSYVISFKILMLYIKRFENVILNNCLLNVITSVQILIAAKNCQQRLSKTVFILNCPLLNAIDQSIFPQKVLMNRSIPCTSSAKRNVV